MTNKEQISTLVTTGANLPPVNPYLDDDSSSNDDGTPAPVKKTKSKGAPVISKPVKTVVNKPMNPDPKEYIAELERPEDEDII